DPAKNLTPADTGLLDKPLADLNKYFSDNVKGIEAKSAYAVFQNTLRNALFGSALTEAEISAFNEAYGTLKEQMGPALTQFKTALTQVQSRLESAMQSTNPISAKVRLG